MLAVAAYLVASLAPPAIAAAVALGAQQRTRVLSPQQGDADADADAARGVASFNVCGTPAALRYATFSGDADEYDAWQRAVVAHLRRNLFADARVCAPAAVALQGAWAAAWAERGPEQVFDALRAQGYFVTTCEPTQLISPGLAVATRQRPSAVRLYTFWRREAWQWLAGMPAGALAVRAGGRWVVSTALSRRRRTRLAQTAALAHFCRTLLDDGEPVLLCGTLNAPPARALAKLKESAYAFRHAAAPVGAATFDPESPARPCLQPFPCKRWLCPCLPRPEDDAEGAGVEAGAGGCCRCGGGGPPAQRTARDAILALGPGATPAEADVFPAARISPHALLRVAEARAGSAGSSLRGVRTEEWPTAPAGELARGGAEAEADEAEAEEEAQLREMERLMGAEA